MSSDDDFFVQLSKLLGTPQMSAEERTAVLDLARLVAHGSERRYAPLTAYALGLSMSAADNPDSRRASVRHAIAKLESTMAEPEPEPGSGIGEDDTPPVAGDADES